MYNFIFFIVLRTDARGCIRSTLPSRDPDVLYNCTNHISRRKVHVTDCFRCAHRGCRGLRKLAELARYLFHSHLSTFFKLPSLFCFDFK
jgi:hypothetical protein